MLDSKSTDKLQIICDTLEKKILEDDTLKSRINQINITWKILDNTIVPDVNIDFK